MSLHHAASGEIVSLEPLGPKLPETVSTAIVKSSQLEVMRLVLAAGKSLPEHQVPGDLTLQCLEGVVQVSAHGKSQALHAGEMLYLAGHVRHALQAVENASVLLTMVLPPSQ
jgi:quercetin dioxygenase-like cupin family protein